MANAGFSQEFVFPKRCSVWVQLQIYQWTVDVFKETGNCKARQYKAHVWYPFEVSIWSEFSAFLLLQASITRRIDMSRWRCIMSFQEKRDSFWQMMEKSCHPMWVKLGFFWCLGSSMVIVFLSVGTIGASNHRLAGVAKTVWLTENIRADVHTEWGNSQIAVKL